MLCCTSCSTVQRNVPYWMSDIPCKLRVCDRHFREHGALKVNKTDAGAICTCHNTQLEENVLRSIEEEPSTIRTCTIACAVSTNHHSVWEVLCGENCYPHHILQVQVHVQKTSPSTQHFVTGLRSSNWISFPHYHSLMMFTWDRLILNSKESREWAEENPHLIRENNYLRRFSVNIWTSVISDRIIDPNLFLELK